MSTEAITLFLAGDVMTGRGIDQILPHPSDPTIHEACVTSAADYVALAEARSGRIPRRADFAYVWGDALAELDRIVPDARIVNLETAITTSDTPWPGKGVNYRMSPLNVPCLAAARIDCCVLANNHVLDWGYPGLEETLETLRAAGIGAAGAGRDAAEAATPGLIATRNGRVAVFGFGSESSGIPAAWAASPDRPGVNLLPDLSEATVRHIALRVNAAKAPGTVTVASVHWGANWGHSVPPSYREFAHRLIDEAGIDVVHGHSSHHPKAIEVYRRRLILYGCGDLLSDYEGIGGRGDYRADLGLMYFVGLDPETGNVESVRMTPTRIRRFTVTRASAEEGRRLAEILDRESRTLGTRVHVGQDLALSAEPD